MTYQILKIIWNSKYVSLNVSSSKCIGLLNEHFVYTERKDSFKAIFSFINTIVYFYLDVTQDSHVLL